MKRMTILLTLLICLSPALCSAADYWRKAATDYPFPIVLVDVTDGYSPENEKKYGDTTITVTDLTDGNTPVSFTDDATSWKEVGDGTGEYRLLIGAEEFDEPDSDYLVKVVVAGCRTVRFTVHTLVGSPGNMATTDDGGAINVASGVVDADAVKVSTSATAADNLEVKYATNWATAWNSVTKMENVDVNYVQDSNPLTMPGYDDIIEGFKAQIWDAAYDGAGAANSPSKRIYDNLTGNIATLIGPVNVDLATDIAAIALNVSAVTDPWSITVADDPNFADSTKSGYLLLNTYKLLNGKL